MKGIDAFVSIATCASCDSSGADLVIWDLDLCANLPPMLTDPDEQVLLLVGRQSMPLLESDGRAHHCALLKPLNGYTVRAFLEMAERNCRLQRQASERAHFRSDRDALLEYALATNLRLQEYEHERTNFLARAVHDLRVPLTALHGYCGLLAAGQMGPLSAEQRDLLSRMQSSTRRLARQSAGMFELAIRGTVPKRTQRSATDIEDTVLQAVHEVYPQIQDKDQEIALNMSAPDGTLMTDAPQMTQVFLNLLENCSKFSPSAALIEITGENVHWHKDTRQVHAENVTGTDAYRIDVRDTGPGIEPSLLSAIFEQYTSYSAGGDRSGGGLGLAICKMIVTDHNGLIWAENSHQGAVFSVLLPFATSACHTAVLSEVVAVS